MIAPGPMLSRYRDKTVLAIGAHPDDVELGVGGTAARLHAAGARVVVSCVCVPTELERRLAEARAAAGILGGEFRAIFSDRCLRVEDIKGSDLRQALEGLIEEFTPALVLAHGTADFHRDHQLVHQACRESQRLRFFDFLCYPPTSCRRIPARFDPEAFVDISETIDKKVEAIDAHASQFSGRGLETDVFRRIAREYGETAGVPYAEGLEIMRLRLD